MAYALGDYLIRTIMSRVSGLPEDEVINDFAVSFGALDPPDAALLGAIGAVGDFFRLGAGPVDQVGSYISDGISRAVTHRITATQIVAGPMGAPRMDVDWLGPVSPMASNNLPSEVAGVLSFHADLTGIDEEVGATRPRARRRGRLYIGPLTDDAIVPADPDPGLSAGFNQALRGNATAMFDALALDGFAWSVWSRADQVLRPVVGGWTDNACDTQRRRGPSATSRIVFTT